MEKLELNISVSQLANLKGDVTKVIHDINGQRYFKKTYQKLEFIIDYPLDHPKKVIVREVKSLADILIPLAKAYKKIYKTPAVYGIYGHGIEDLFFEGIKINPTGPCELIVGS